MRAGAGWQVVPLAVVLASLQGCGGGGGSVTVSSGATTPTATSISAATATAASNASCSVIAPFYWEIGNKNGPLASSATGDGTVTSATSMLIASASKWLFGAYVVEKRSGALTADDLKALTMRAGYTSFVYGDCLRAVPANQSAETVDQCFTSGNNNVYTAANNGKFYYSGGHFQWLADNNLGLGADNNAQLATDVAAQIGQDFSFSFNSPQLAGGVQSTGGDYAIFLRKLLNGQLRISAMLGSNAVCTNPGNCSDAVYAPIPLSESWHYSLAHWVEDDPLVGDGSFSSPGAFGFYPWIDKSKAYYGVLARYDSNTGGPVQGTPYYKSVVCGRAIRKAWFTGLQQ